MNSRSVSLEGVCATMTIALMMKLTSLFYTVLYSSVLPDTGGGAGDALHHKEGASNKIRLH